MPKEIVERLLASQAVRGAFAELFALIPGTRRFLACVQGDPRMLGVFDFDNPQQPLTIFRHAGKVTCCSIEQQDDEQTMIISGSEDGALSCWDAATGACIRVLVGHQAAVTCCLTYPRRGGLVILAGSRDHNLYRWDAMTGALIDRLIGHANSINSCFVYHINKRLYILSAGDSRLQRWDADSGVQIDIPWEWHADEVTCCLLYRDQDKTRILSGSVDGSLCRWNASTGDGIGLPLQLNLDIAVTCNCCAAFYVTEQSLLILAGGSNGILYIFDAATARLLESILLPSVPISIQRVGKWLFINLENGTHIKLNKPLLRFILSNVTFPTLEILAMNSYLSSADPFRAEMELPYGLL